MKLTKDNVKAGMTIYWMHGTNEPIHKARILEIINKANIDNTRLRLIESEGYHQYIFPSDRGVPGFAYDDRMCQIYTSKRDAEYARRMAASLDKGTNMNWIRQDELDAACLNGPQRRIIK